MNIFYSIDRPYGIGATVFWDFQINFSCENKLFYYNNNTKQFQIELFGEYKGVY